MPLVVEVVAVVVVVVEEEEEEKEEKRQKLTLRSESKPDSLTVASIHPVLLPLHVAFHVWPSVLA